MALEDDVDALSERVNSLEDLVMAIVAIMGISRQRLATEYGITFPVGK